MERLHHTKQKVTWYALIPAILTPVCLLFPYGYSIGTINSAATSLRQFYNQSYYMRFGEPMPHVVDDFVWGLTASIFPLGGVIGAPLVRPLVAKFGRRGTLIYVQGISLIATLFIGFSAALNIFELIIVSRGLIGIYCSICTGVGPMYVSEISATHIRGVVGGLFSVSIALGIFWGNVLGLQQILGTISALPYLFAVNSLPAVIYLLYSRWLPKSPRALYLEDAKIDEAREVLKRLRGTTDVELEMEMLRNQVNDTTKVKPMSVIEALTTRRVRWQVISGIVIMASLQFSGINGIHYNLRNVFLLAGISPDIVIYVAIGVVFFQVIITVIGGFLTKKYGRKSLLLFGNSVIIVSMIIYTIATAYLSTIHWFSYVSLVAAVGIIIGFCTGNGPVTFTIVPELMDQATRPAAMTLGVLSLWISFAIVGFVTPYLFEYLGYLVFLPFMLATFFAVIYIYFVVPETLGKSVLEIQEFFAKIPRRHVLAVDATAEQEMLDVQRREDTETLLNTNHS